jgi:hypothetical protein
MEQEVTWNMDEVKQVNIHQPRNLQPELTENLLTENLQAPDQHSGTTKVPTAATLDNPLETPLNVAFPTPTEAASLGVASLPWPGEDHRWPVVSAVGVSTQVVPLFDPEKTLRQKRFLLLAEATSCLPPELSLTAGTPSDSKVESSANAQPEVRTKQSTQSEQINLLEHEPNSKFEPNPQLEPNSQHAQNPPSLHAETGVSTPGPTATPTSTPPGNSGEGSSLSRVEVHTVREGSQPYYFREDEAGILLRASGTPGSMPHHPTPYQPTPHQPTQLHPRPRHTTPYTTPTSHSPEAMSFAGSTVASPTGTPAALREIGLRLGLELEDGYSWWQWTRAELLWHGPVADAWRIGGHIVTHTVAATPTLPEAWTSCEAIARLAGRQIAADVYLVVFHSGLVQITAHFKNNHYIVPAEDVPGLPVIQITGLAGSFAETVLDGSQLVLDGSGGDFVDLEPCADLFDSGHPGLVHPVDGGGILLRPFDRVEIVAHKTKTNELVYLGKPDQRGLPAGVSRSITLDVHLSGHRARPVRLRVPSVWYAHCGVLNGITNGPCEEPHLGLAHDWAARSRDAIYENTARGGFDTGRVWRYLRRDLRSGEAQLDDAEWEGGTTQALLIDSYVRPEAAHWHLIRHQLYHFADIAVHHGHMMVRCHGYNTMHAPLPGHRVGALVLGYAETGDPYLLETARAVADTWMWRETTNEPRHAMGRDAYPLAGVMTLYDYTGDERYLDFGRQLVTRLLATQTPGGGFTGQGGVGLLGGRGNVGGDKDISFGNGLLAPIGLFEWALRDQRHPPKFREQMTRWYELVLSMQQADGGWPQGSKEGNPSYPLIAAGLLFTFSAYHRLWNDARGLRALRRYLECALARGEFLLGTHSFLAVLYATFFEMEVQLEDQTGRSMGRPMKQPV